MCLTLSARPYIEQRALYTIKDKQSLCCSFISALRTLLAACTRATQNLVGFVMTSRKNSERPATESECKYRKVFLKYLGR